MTDEQLGMVVATLQQLNRGFTEIARHVLEQEADIGAIRSILEQKGVAPAEELDRARDEAARGLKEGSPAVRKRRCRRISAYLQSGVDPRSSA